MDHRVRPSERIEDAVDDILDQLDSTYDTEELPLRRDLAFHHAVIDHGGDLDAARTAADADAASYDETLDYLTVQTTAALNPAAIGTSAATRQLAVAACHEWFAQAHAGFTRDYRAAVPPDVQAQFGTGYMVAARTFQLPPWSGSFTRSTDELEKSLTAHWDRHTAPFIAGYAFPWARKAAPPALTLAGILVIIGSFRLPAALIIAAIVGAVWGLVLYNGAQTARRLQDDARTILDSAKLESVHQLRAASAELTDWKAKLATAEGTEPACREMIRSLRTAVSGGSRFEGRTVAKEEPAS
jgi:hypothetical protein